VDPNATMLRILDAIKANDREACAEATEDLAEWLRRGGFAPKFTAAMAGTTRYGELRRFLRLGERYAIMTTDPNGDGDGWEFVEFTVPCGNTLHRWGLADEFGDAA